MTCTLPRVATSLRVIRHSLKVAWRLRERPPNVTLSSPQPRPHLNFNPWLLHLDISGATDPDLHHGLPGGGLLPKRYPDSNLQVDNGDRRRRGVALRHSEYVVPTEYRGMGHLHEN